MNPIWQEILLVTLFNIGAICLVIGLCLCIAPRRFIDATVRFNRWISTDTAFASLDKSRPADRFFYRRHLWVGAFLAIGSLYILYVFWIWYDRARLLPILPVIGNVGASAWIYDSIVALLRGTGLIGFLAGTIITFRPSMLKSLESWANHWVSTERWTRSLDRQKELPSQWFPGRARWFGLGIAIGSLYIMLRCGSALWASG